MGRAGWENFFLHVVVAIFGPGLGCDVMVAGPFPAGYRLRAVAAVSQAAFYFRFASLSSGGLSQRGLAAAKTEGRIP